MPKCFGMHSLRRFPFPTTPSAPLKEASRLLLDVAATPPMSGGEWHAQFIHIFFDPPTDITWTPSFPRRGVCAINNKAPVLSGADGVASKFQQK